jgi:hypothetical protein|nr:MAG TPA: Putative methionine and alanine importer, small subunit [Microviridae sp.]
MSIVFGNSLVWLISGLFALAFYGAIFWAIIEFIRYLRRK